MPNRLRKIRPFRAIRQRLNLKKRISFLRSEDNQVPKEKSPITGKRAKVGKFLSFVWAILKQVFRFLQGAWRRFRWVTRSLWFRLMGAFAVVILLMLIIVSSVISSVTSRAFNQYVIQRNQYIQDVLPSIVEPELLNGSYIEIRGDQIIIQQRRFLPESPELPERPEMPELPEMPEMPEIPEFPEIPVIPERPEGVASEEIVALPTPTVSVHQSVFPDEPVDETAVFIQQPDGQVILEDVIEIPLLELLAPTLPEAIGLNFLSEVQDAATTAVIAAGVMSLILGTLLFRYITKPLSQMRHASQALAAGDLNVTVPVRTQDELGKVAEAFNQMATEIGNQEQARRQMVADVAHELRTPLTVMKANLEGMLDGLLEPNPGELQELHDEVQRLSRLIDDLRLLSLVDSGQLSLSRRRADVRDVITTVVSRLSPLAEANTVKLVDDVPAKPILLAIDEDRLQQALANLVANGIRHTPEGGRVRVTAVVEKRKVHLSVIDSGPGIAAEDLPHVFDRFWRGDKSRSRHSGGSGLGLAIVKQIAELHDGGVTAISPNNSGAIFTISLPN
ncbi:MAG: ATP-binding protein [Chloroflexota bacterium]